LLRANRHAKNWHWRNLHDKQQILFEATLKGDCVMGIGIWQILLILVIVLILFGAGKLPKMMGDLGKGMKSFKQGLKEGDEAENQPSISVDNKPASPDDAPKS
jgi:sec-independent protein translocase protein TatA